MNEEQIAQFEQVEAQLEGLYTEISLLSKSKPHDAINKFKINFINLVLSSANEVLQEGYRPFSNFEKFTDDDLPSNSDVVFMLSQYINSLDKLRADNITERYDCWYWIIEGEPSDIRTAPPRKVMKK